MSSYSAAACQVTLTAAETTVSRMQNWLERAALLRPDAGSRSPWRGAADLRRSCWRRRASALSAAPRPRAWQPSCRCDGRRCLFAIELHASADCRGAVVPIDRAARARGAGRCGRRPASAVSGRRDGHVHLRHDLGAQAGLSDASQLGGQRDRLGAGARTRSERALAVRDAARARRRPLDPAALDAVRDHRGPA